MKSKDIAKMFNISPAALSLIINNKPGVSDELRKDVITKIKDMGYSSLLKNNQATAIKQKSIFFIIYHDSGELLGSNNNSFFPFIIDGIEQCTHKHGYNLTYVNIARDRLSEGLARITKEACAGFVIFATELNGDQITPFLELDIPFVLLDSFYNNLDVNSVTVNNEQGTFIAVEHLYNSGHRKIGFLTSGLDFTSFIERRHSAFKAMAAFGLTGMEKYKYEVGYPDTGAYEGMKSLLIKEVDLPTAFLMDNDLIAGGAIRALKEFGYRVPDDISLVGFDDRPICTLIEPQLTTVRIPRISFGAEAVELLLRQIEGTTTCIVKTALNSRLVVRDSVKKLNTQ